ncbi:MAG: hypothetical protein KDD59_08195 [Bdellovibrionales bacterium]|nr:hypothetical protein [Bdellovibrionales bacterium]
MFRFQKQLGLFLVFVLATVALNSSASAETEAERHTRLLRRLLPLNKITVGPYDNYQGSFVKGGQHLLFSRKVDLAPRIYKLDLNTGKETPLLDLAFDSKDPHVSSTGDKIVFVYFKNRARGQVCVKSIDSADAESCLDHSTKEPAFPVWVGEHQVAFILRDLAKRKSEVVLWDLKAQNSRVVAQGHISSLTWSKSQQKIIYTSDDGIVVSDVSGVSKYDLKLDLPGMPGFLSAGEDGYVYFSHYLSDTNNDQIVDANDNAVVFRLPLGEAKGGSRLVFPEPLTSVEYNCSFPQVEQQSLLVTCAFEGTLDIYELPHAGMVPSSWDHQILENARKTSRTYAERLFLTQSLIFRNGTFSAEKSLQQLMSNHLLAEDGSATRYYLKRLIDLYPKTSSLYALLDVYVQGLQFKKKETVDPLSRAFSREVSQFLTKLGAIKGVNKQKKLVHALFDLWSGNGTRAAAVLKDQETLKVTSTIDGYLLFQLIETYSGRRGAVARGVDSGYLALITTSDLPEESQLFYTHRLLTYIQKSEPDLKKRKTLVARFQKKCEPGSSVETLMQAEVASLNIVLTSGLQDKRKVYSDLDKLMSQTRDNYYLRKALYVRAIATLVEADKYDIAGYVATNWLKYTKPVDTEFSYAKTQYIYSVFDEAYSSYGSQNYLLASNHFLAGLRLTDDLEAHFGYIQSLLKLKKRQEIDKQYDNLKKRSFIGDNITYVETLLELLDGEERGTLESKDVRRAVDGLNGLTVENFSPVLHLTIGALYVWLLDSESKGLNFSQEDLDKAHKHLMLAFDLGRNNQRLRASALIDLGLLHQRVRNYSLSARFFADRKKFGFTSDEERLAFSWLYSRTLYLSNNASGAAAELAELLSTQPKAEGDGYLFERLAFYQQASEQCKQSIANYDKAFAKLLKLADDQHEMKMHLGRGVCYFREERKKPAKEDFLKVVEISKTLVSEKPTGDRPLPFRPERQQLLALGYLAQLSQGAESAGYLEERAQLLDLVGDQINSFAMKEESLLGFKVKNNLQLAEKRLESGRNEGANRYLVLALRDSWRLVGDLEQPLSVVALNAVEAYLLLAATKNYERSGDGHKLAGQLTSTIQEALVKVQKTQQQPIWAFRQTKLALLWAKYEGRNLDQELTLPQAVFLKQQSPERWQQLKELSQLLAAPL